MENRYQLLITSERLQNLLVSRAAGGTELDDEYQQLRNELLAEPSMSSWIPRFMWTCRSLDQFWQFIKYEFSHYHERREFLWGQFRPLLAFLEGANERPIDQSVSEALASFDVDTVHQVWARALERRTQDPEGAITLSRTLLESVCKHILDEVGVEYRDSADLPKLYHLTAEQLRLAPSQHSERVFKQILGGCTSVVQGLGALRNRLGDSHGKGKSPVKPAARHAELAVNLAGTMATFLVSTWNARQEVSR